MLNARRVVPAVVLLLCAATAGAQLNSDTVPTNRTVPVRDGVESQIENSRWQIGPFRIAPELQLNDIGYNDNVFGASEGEEKVGDYTATIGGGLRSIAPIGSKTYLRLDAIPNYTWYQDLTERRNLGFEANAAFLALFNRASLEVGTRVNDFVGLVSSEDSTLVKQKTGNFLVRGEVDLASRLALFAAFEAENTDYNPEAEDIDYTILNREETAQRIGLRYELRPRFHLQLMYEMTDSDFPDDPTFFRNEGDAVLVGFTYDRERLFVNAVGGNRTIDYPGSGAPQFDEFTGSLYATWTFARRSMIQFSIRQRPQYSTYVENPYFLESRQGARLVVPMGQRFVVFGGGETGKNEYQAPVIVDGASVERADDVSNWEAGIGFRVLRSAVLTLSTKVEDYSSNLSSFDRKVVTTGINLKLGETLYR
ncbi:MAG: hypothetical protein WC538_22245 [Thermoanaerobaculia bacterium]|jgi:hypothetical protein